MEITKRVLVYEPATLTHTFYVGEEATAPTGTPTFTAVAADGVEVQAGNCTVDATTVSVALNGVSTLEWLTVTITATVGGSTRIASQTVEIVGGFFWTLAQGRASDESLAETLKYTAADLEQGRLEVETECEMICDRAFVPRYQRIILNGSGTSDLLLLHSDDDRTAGDVRTLRSVKMAGRADATFTTFTTDELAAVQISDDNRLIRVDGGTWIEGWRNIVIEYEYGLDAPPADLRGASLLRLRTVLNRNRSGIPDRASSYTVDGGTFRLDSAGRYKVGIGDVDGPYARYSRRPDAGPGQAGAEGAGVGRPASRTLTYQPQRWSMFHNNR